MNAHEAVWQDETRNLLTQFEWCFYFSKDERERMGVDDKQLEKVKDDIRSSLVSITTNLSPQMAETRKFMTVAMINHPREWPKGMESIFSEELRTINVWSLHS